MYDLIIIGLGPGGINACIYAKRSNLNVLVIERGMPGGTLHNIKEVENYLGYEHINGSDLAMQFYKQFKDLKIPMVNEEVQNITLEDNIKVIETSNNTYIVYLFCTFIIIMKIQYVNNIINICI